MRKIMTNRYTFPAILREENGVVGVVFLDLPGCVTVGNDHAHALEMAEEALMVHLYGMERDGDEIPSPNMAVFSTRGMSGGLLVLVKTDLSIIRREKRRKAVKKTLTIPQWMDEEAKAQDINFSAVLQEGLAERLGGTGRRN